MDNQSGGNRSKESPGKEVEVVWACDKKRGTLRRKEGDGNESRRERGRPKRRWLDRVRDDIKEKGLSVEEMYDRARVGGVCYRTSTRYSSYNAFLDIFVFLSQLFSGLNSVILLFRHTLCINIAGSLSCPYITPVPLYRSMSFANRRCLIVLPFIET